MGWIDTFLQMFETVRPGLGGFLCLGGCITGISRDGWRFALS